MTYSLLYMVQESKRWCGSPLLNETTLDETDLSLPIDGWVRGLNHSQKYLQGKMVRTFEDWLGRTQTITFTSGTSTYSLPSNLIQVRLLERTDSTPDQKMYPIGITDKFKYSNDLNSIYPYSLSGWYAIWGDKLFITPTFSGTGQIWYIRSMPDLMYGTASSVTATTIVFPVTPSLGTLSNENDYYNGSRIKIVSATTGAGQIQEITDYDYDTKTATVVWQNGVTPTGTIVYSILTDIPDDYIELLTLRTAIATQIKDKDTEAFNGMATRYNELEQEFIFGLANRKAQESNGVNYISDGYE